LINITAGVREREDANRTREAGHLDEIQDVGGPCAEMFGTVSEKRSRQIRDRKSSEAELGTDVVKSRDAVIGCCAYASNENKISHRRVLQQLH
jgi:hypothetical protein